MTCTRGDDAAVWEDLAKSWSSSRLPHELQAGHLPVLVVVMCPQLEQIYFVI